MQHPMFQDDAATELSERERGGRDDDTAFRITVIDGADKGKSLVVDAGSAPQVAGKSAAGQLVLADARVSRRHVSFDASGGQLRVTDLGSTNGTFVNGVRIGEVFLQGGESVALGGTVLRVDRAVAPPSMLGRAEGFGRLLGASPAMRRLYPILERLAASNVPVIVEGETGTGKELLSESLHEAGPRRAGPFVVLDCGAVVPSAVEEILFGVEGKGSRGVFEQAHEGTLLIDEVSAMPVDLQSKLLRAIERGEFHRVGGNQWVKVDVRVIATTTRDVEKEVEAGRLREDLFFRLAVGRVEVPPLRRRQGDVELLANHFARRSGGPEAVVPPDFLRRYEGYGWPGNVRELQNVVARRLALGEADADPASVRGEQEGAPEHAFRWALEQNLPFTSARDLVLSEFQRAYVERVLAEHDGNVSRAAIASGIARRYFQILRARQR